MPCASSPAIKPGEHVAGAGGGEPGRRVVGDRSAAVGRRHHRVGALEQHDRARSPRPRCAPSRASSEMFQSHVVEKPGELAFMRGQDRGRRRARRMAANRRRGSSAKLVSASASSTTARSPGERREDQVSHRRARRRRPGRAPPR